MHLTLIERPLSRLLHGAAALGLVMWLAVPAVALAQAAPAARAAAAAPPRFDIFEYRIEGNTVLPNASIERAVTPYLGPARSVDDVEQARVALEQAYRKAGYGTVVVDTPEQKITDAVVTLKVTQGEVSRLRVVGARYYSQGRILAAVPGVAEGQVPNFNEVQAQLGDVNRSADRRVTPLLRPGKQPGSTEVDLMVEDKLPLHGNVELSNRYAANTTKPRLQASLRYDNLWQREHSLAVQAQVSPADVDQVQVLAGSYTVPLGRNQLGFTAIRSRSRTQANVGGTSVLGNANIFGLRYVMALDAPAEASRSISIGADYKNIKEIVEAPFPLRYMPIRLGYSETRGNREGLWQGGASLTFAVRGIGSKEIDFDNKRFNARSNFAIVKADLARTEFLPRGYSLFGKAELQFSSQPLVSNEQFVAGGVDSVRGYLESTAVGDSALRASLELRSPNLVAADNAWFALVRGHVFVDGAHLELRSPLPGQTSRFTLLGTGVGLRVQARQYASLAVDVGWPLREVGTARRNEPQLHASGQFEF